MSVTNKKITQLTIKPAPVGADIITILDSQTSDPAFQNKSVTLNSIANNIWTRDAGSGFIYPTNLTDNIGIGTDTPTEKLDVSGNLKASGIIKFSTSEIIPLTRTLPITVNDVVQIGDFALTNGTSMFNINVVVASSGFSVTKAYMIPVHFDQTSNIWDTLLSISSTEHFAGNNFELEIRVNNTITSFRIRRTGGSTAGTAQIKIVRTGVVGDTFTPSTATSTESIPASIFKSTALTQIKSNIGINTNAPTEALDIFGNLKISGNLDVGGTNNIQGTAPAYTLKTYNINDLVTESDITYRCIIPITTPETFTPSKWHSLESVEFTAKGDLLSFSDEEKILPVGSDGQVLAVDVTTVLGLNWINPALEEIGRSELTTGVETMSVLLSKQKKNLFVKFLIIPAISFLSQMRFNNDTSATIAESIFDDYTTVTSQINDNDIQISDVAGESEPITGVIHITNIPTQIKQGIVLKTGTNGSTAGTVPTTKTNMFKWTNTTNGISTIQFTSSSASVSYGVGSYIIVYGFD